jgi:hypothetical protein
MVGVPTNKTWVGVPLHIFSAARGLSEPLLLISFTVQFLHSPLAYQGMKRLNGKGRRWGGKEDEKQGTCVPANPRIVSSFASSLADYARSSGPQPPFPP